MMYTRLISTQRRKRLDAVAWYLAGGATPYARYQPQGAETLAASYVNLANPGTYDITPIAAPALSADGWVFAGAEALNTGIPSAVYMPGTVVIRYVGLPVSGLAAGDCGYLGYCPVSGMSDDHALVSLFTDYAACSGQYEASANVLGYSAAGYGEFSAWQQAGLLVLASDAVTLNSARYAFTLDNTPNPDCVETSLLIGVLAGPDYAGGVAYADYFIGTVKEACCYADTLSAQAIAAMLAALN